MQKKALRANALHAALFPQCPPPALPNPCSSYRTWDEEQQAREQAVTEQMRVLRAQLPGLLVDLARIPDPRQPRKCRHRLPVLLLYGLLMFVFQIASRREANRSLTRP